MPLPISLVELVKDGVVGSNYFLLNLSSTVLAARNMSQNSPHAATENTPASPSQSEPLNVPPLSFLPQHLSNISLASRYSESSRNPLGKVPTEAEVREELEELEGQARIADKVKEAEMKKASKVREREGEKGQGWCQHPDF
jgi:hypothetical protein